MKMPLIAWRFVNRLLTGIFPDFRFFGILILTGKTRVRIFPEKYLNYNSKSSNHVLFISMLHIHFP